MHGVTLGASTPIIVAIDRVRNMGFVVGRVKVLTIPTSRKLWRLSCWSSRIWYNAYRNLGSDLVTFVSGKMADVVSRYANTFVRHSSAGKVIGLVSLKGITSKHAEPRRESGKLIIVWATARHWEVSVEFRLECLGHTHSNRWPCLPFGHHPYPQR